jgi:hypothetical protein
MNRLRRSRIYRPNCCGAWPGRLDLHAVMMRCVWVETEVEVDQK